MFPLFLPYLPLFYHFIQYIDTSGKKFSTFLSTDSKVINKMGEIQQNKTLFPGFGPLNVENCVGVKKTALMGFPTRRVKSLVLHFP